MKWVKKKTKHGHEFLQGPLKPASCSLLSEKESSSQVRNHYLDSDWGWHWERVHVWGKIGLLKTCFNWSITYNLSVINFKHTHLTTPKIKKNPSLSPNPAPERQPSFWLYHHRLVVPVSEFCVNGWQLSRSGVWFLWSKSVFAELYGCSCAQWFILSHCSRALHCVNISQLGLGHSGCS